MNRICPAQIISHEICRTRIILFHAHLQIVYYNNVSSVSIHPLRRCCTYKKYERTDGQGDSSIPPPETLLARGIKNVIIISHNALLWNVGWLGILLLWRFASFHLQGKYTVDLSHQKHVFLSYDNTTTTTTTMQQRICYTKPSLSIG